MGAAVLKVGFTGTRKGMTDPQRKMVASLLNILRPKEVHHGDGVGADAQFHALCADRTIPTVVHPPNEGASQARYVESHVKVLPLKDPAVRDHNIVNACDLVIVAPESRNESRAGVWTTVRYAKRKKVKVCLVYPDGNIMEVGQ